LKLDEKQAAAIDKCVENKIPFGLTPYYLSLMDAGGPGDLDLAVRAQVIPPADYVDMMASHRGDREFAFDFMGEHDTSPVDLVTRRYPGVAILKPFNTCSQICVYCQRNWEIDEVLDPKAMAEDNMVDKAVAWFDEHPGVGDVLITGGDPCVMKDDTFRRILEAVAAKDHVYRIRIGTRTPVVLPQRWTDEHVAMFKSFREPGKREICIITHFEHPYEITPEVREAVRRIKNAGMNVYNQCVYTFFNSRRFEAVKLRKDLRTIGVDPYYNFNTKGKDETAAYLVPIARILQERKEEARLLPGMDRTDEPVFNVPRLGKNHLRAWQDHQVVMIRPNGARVYEFHPWEKNLQPVPPYYHTDVVIHEYLVKLKERGENIEDYRTIWYYF
jgi:lysine 2,3-aminomutase